MGSSISGTVTSTVDLGSAAYPSPLTVTGTGAILPAAAGAFGVYASQAGVSLSNAGRIEGGAGQADGGGAAVDFTAKGTLSNTGSIVGGATGNTSVNGTYGNGGDGVMFAGGALTNGDLITGGGAYGAGGVGVVFSGAGTLTNTGTIAGGAHNIYSYELAAGGNGVDLGAGAVLSNHGAISGGDSDSNTAAANSVGVYVGAGAMLANDGQITGGGQGGHTAVTAGAGVSIVDAVLVNNAGGTISSGHLNIYIYTTSHATTIGGAGIDASGATLTNLGVVNGGAGAEGYLAQNGGVGIRLSNDSTLTNGGHIYGGAGGNGYENGFSGGAGGTAVSLYGAGVITNAGTILGGAGGTSITNTQNAGGVGILIDAGSAVASFRNTGLIEGGNSTKGARNQAISPTGVQMSGIVDASNAGTILGGSGEFGGGVGLSMSSGERMVNAGTIAGGASGGLHGGSAVPQGGAGVNLRGGVLVTSGTISGGDGGKGGVQGDAVQFGSDAATLTILPGATFSGDVVANTAVRDVLTLAGTTLGTLSGLGTLFTGFTQVTVAAGADWALAGTNTLGAGTHLSVAGTLWLAGTFTDAAIATASGTLVASGTSVAVLNGITLRGGDLQTAAGAQLVVGSTAAGAFAGNITIDAGAAIAGFGTLGGGATAAIVDNGLLSARGGTLVLDSAVSGDARIVVAKNGIVLANAHVGGGRMVFDSGTGEGLSIAAGVTVDTMLVGFKGADVIDFLHTAATSLAFTGNTLLLEDGSQNVGTLQFASGYSLGNFALNSDGHGGSKITFVVAAAEHGAAHLG